MDLTLNDIEFDADRANLVNFDFTIYDELEIIKKDNCSKIGQTDNLINAVKQSKIETGIMISSMHIDQILIYLLILDDSIIIIRDTNLHKYQEYFSTHLNSLIFFNTKCREGFNNSILNQNSVSDQNDQSFKTKANSKKLQNEIVRSIIKKSQYRTLKMRQQPLPDNFNINNEYLMNNFIVLRDIARNVRLCYNKNLQILNILKNVDSDGYKHEKEFYQQIENSFPFICKIFGKTKDFINSKLLVLEYIEGKTLKKFIKNDKNIEMSTKIKIIIEILFSVLYVHSNGFFLRDLKGDNIIIDSSNNAILIDFDNSKKIYSPIENSENTTDIGIIEFTAPEIYTSNTYSYKADIYSVGMIINFIMTGVAYKCENLTEIIQKNGNISDNKDFPRCPQGYEFFQNVYKKCFEISPKSRPNIPSLINDIIFENNDNELKIIKKQILPIIINEFQRYGQKLNSELIFKFEKTIEKLYLQYFLGYIFYSGEYISRDINKSIHYFTLSSNQNNSYAQYYLGGIYYSGEYISRDINKSIHYLTLSSNQNYSDARFLLGAIYYSGEYISRDINKSIHYLTLSSNQNNSNAQYYLGEIYYFGKYISRDINKSIHYLTLSSNQNNSYAQYYLGGIYYFGKYISRDINKSIHYLTLSSNQNNSDAQFLLGAIYYLGKYISRDINKSIHYFTLSSNQNNSDAQYYLGKIFYSGENISRDINKSIHYLTLSSNQNNSDAQFLLGEIYYSGKYISRDINKSIYYFTLSSNQNNSNAQFLLGEIYYFGEYISRDINKSIHYLTLSSNQNNSNAQYYLGGIYYSGEYISRDINKSIHYFTLSSNQNNSYAQFLLGEIYYSGEYISRDINKSIHYLTLSSNQNNSNAQFLLGAIYYSGEYISQDINKSIHYLTLSSNQNNSDAQLLLGEIYYEGLYAEKNIQKSFHYFIEASIKQDTKNYIGLIYKNGITVQKNINYAIIYFEEAIKEKNNTYAMYNLARIYYFCIDIEKDIPKSIKLLEKASEKHLHYADLFLFYIYEYCDEEKYRDYKKSHKYRKNLYNHFNYAILSIIDIFNNRLYIFLKDYDLYTSKYYEAELYSFLLTGDYIVDKLSIIYKELTKSQAKDIDNDFNEGFNN